MKTQEKTDRKKAIEWWSNLDDSMKMNLCRIHFSMRSVSGISVIKLLTGREIEQIWRKETHFQGFFEIHKEKEERPQVDFELLSLSVIAVSNNLKLTKKANLNLKLFFELLSKSSTFAHKAHKELNKLMK